MKISAVLIVKNEEAMLARCLESVKDADEIIICDTGSTDKTIEVAKKYTDKIYTDFVWCDNYEKARNHAKLKATGDWILSIDADEFCHDFNEVRKAVELGKDSASVTMIAENRNGKDNFKVPRLFRNAPHVYWDGAIHNHLSISGEGERVGNVEITYGYSPAHEADPDRTLRILTKEVEDPTKSRERYYLGIELYRREKYLEAITWFGQHVLMTNHNAEKADSFLLMARSYSKLGMDDDARDACLQAVNCNSNFKEAVKFMGAISLDHNAQQWYRMAETATNDGVLFLRT